MNTTKSVYNKLFAEDKVELAAERVELALIDDINKLSDTVKKITQEFESQIKIFEKSKSDLKNMISGRTQQSVELLTKIKDAEKISKELGLKFESTKYQGVLDEYYKTTNKIDAIFK